MLTLVCAAALTAPVGSWSGSPTWRGDTGTNPAPRTIFRNTEVQVTPTTATYKVKTLYKNLASTPVKGEILVPVFGRGNDPEWSKHKITAKFGTSDVSMSGLRADPNVEADWANWYGFPVAFGAGEWKPFEFTVTRPLNKGGEGGAERFVRFVEQDQTDTFEQYQLSVKYPRRLVFQMVSTSPRSGWQIGETGAFWSRKAWRPTKTEFEFRFYPATFEKVGG